jgi:hypothetical protein
MKTLRLLAVSLIVVLSACTWRADPDKHAREFFEEGKESIIKALKKQDASEAQLKAAEAVLARHEQTLPGEIAGVMRKHKAMFHGIVTGQDSATLTRLEADLHQTHEQTARDIGRMHEEVAGAVGDKTWKAATAYLDSRWARHFREGK